MTPIIEESELREQVKGFAHKPMTERELLDNMTALLRRPATSVRPWRIVAPCALVPRRTSADHYVPGKLCLTGQITRAVAAAIPPLMGYKLNRMVPAAALVRALTAMLSRDYKGWLKPGDGYLKPYVQKALNRLACLPMRFRHHRNGPKLPAAVRPLILTRAGDLTHALVLDCFPPFLTKCDYDTARKLHDRLERGDAAGFRYTEAPDFHCVENPVMEIGKDGKRVPCYTALL